MDMVRSVSAKRRLPVLQAPPGDDVPERPPWQWSVFGAGLIVLLWVVLTLLATPVTRLVPASNAIATLLQLAIQAIASFLVGAVIGTWSRRRGVREAAVAGALSALFAAACGAVVAVSTGVATWLDVAISFAGGAALLPSASGAGALGAWLGGRKKRVLDVP